MIVSDPQTFVLPLSHVTVHWPLSGHLIFARLQWLPPDPAPHLMVQSPLVGHVIVDSLH